MRRMTAGGALDPVGATPRRAPARPARPSTVVDGWATHPRHRYVPTHTGVEPPLPRRRTRYERFVKPALDRVGALALLVVTSPVMAATSLGVWLTMGRPVLFRQKRVGYMEEPFDVYKLRT